MSKPPDFYDATFSFEVLRHRRFRTEAGAKRFIEGLKAAFDAAQKVCDGEIWTSIELIYITRIDCPTARLAAA